MYNDYKNIIVQIKISIFLSNNISIIDLMEKIGNWF